MNRVKSLSILLLFAVFSCHLCQSVTTPQPAPDAKNVTVTPAPQSTTQAPKTTTEPPKTTTEAPKTTTVAPKTTTVAPTTPAPVPKSISGKITDNNYTCIRYDFNVHYKIKYNDTKNATQEAILLMPLDSTVTKHNCSAPQEFFALSSKNGDIVLELYFGKNDNSVYMESINLTVKYSNESFPNIDKNLDGKNRTYTLASLNPTFNVEKSHSYFCANVTVPKNDDGEVKVTFENLKLQAFMETSQNGEFSAEHNCQNEINDVVPIAVGAALTGLVVIVMIAYFIGRRRSRRLAYQSV